MNKYLLGLFVFFNVWSIANAQSSYPTRAIKFIAAFPAGSATDQVACLVANQMTKQIGQPVVGPMASLSVSWWPKHPLTVIRCS
ncbi:MAG: hypothetical protein ACKVPZ_02155 [Burkholderiaceae bacterium]